MKKTYRIKSKLRFTSFVVTIMITLVCMSNLVLGLSDVSSLTKETYEEVLINYGDTLWNIASEYNEPGKDVRKFVYEICQINDITADSIFPGQIILVPVVS